MDKENEGVSPMEKNHGTGYDKKRYRSMWTAHSEKRDARFRHARNYKAGFIKVDEYHLRRTGIRGRKRWFVWCMMAVLLTVALANLAANVLLIIVLHMTPSGLPYLVAVPYQDRTLFPKTVNFSTASATSIQGYVDCTVGLQSKIFDIHSKRIDQSTNIVLNSSQIQMDSSFIKIKPYDHFTLTSSSTNDQNDIMTLNKSVAWIRPPLSTSNMISDRLITDSIRAQHVMANCLFSNSCIMKIRESFEGSSSNIMISSESGDVRVSLREGGLVVKKSVQSIFLPTLREYQSGTESGGGRLCICDNGRVFRAMGDSCLIHTNIISNPCRPTT